MRGDLANRCHTVRRRLQLELAEGTGLEPASDKCAVVFGTTALPVRLPFQEEFRISNCGMRICFIEQSFKIRNPKSEILSGACGRTRTYEGQSSPPDFGGGCFRC